MHLYWIYFYNDNNFFLQGKRIESAREKYDQAVGSALLPEQRQGVGSGPEERSLHRKASATGHGDLRFCELSAGGEHSSQAWMNTEVNTVNNKRDNSSDTR